MNKTIIFLLLFVSSSFLTFGQVEKSVLSAPEGWAKEIIPFPIGFAKSIDLVGFEDLRFTPNWRDKDSPNFWTYTFVWYVEKGDSVTESKLSEMLEAYFDGLMKIDFLMLTAPTKPDRTVSVFMKTAEGFKGRMRVHDNFFTKKNMILHAKVKESFCEVTNKQIILFQFSPKGFDDSVWQMFEQVKLIAKCEKE